jgi:hypothetical protein
LAETDDDALALPLQKKIATADNVLSFLAGVSPCLGINLRTNDRRCFRQELPNVALQYRGKTQDALNTDDLHS